MNTYSNYFLISSDLPHDKEPLDWNTRIKIASGAAKGLTYLHEVVNPPVIYRDLKSSNILLDDDFNPKLSDFGLAKVGPIGDNTHVSTRVMGTYGYCAPDYIMSGKLNVKSDVYSFGVVLLELITGRKAFDMSRKFGEQKLIVWVCFCNIYFLVLNSSFVVFLRKECLNSEDSFRRSFFFPLFNSVLMQHICCVFSCAFD